MKIQFKPVDAVISQEYVSPDKSWISRFIRWFKGQKAKEGYVIVVHLKTSSLTSSLIEKGDLIRDRSGGYKYFVTAKESSSITIRHIELMNIVPPVSFYRDNTYGVFASAYLER